MSTESAFPQIPRFLYGTAWKEDATERCVENALKAGFRGIDTANQRMHYYEEGVGKALQSVYAQGLLTRADVFLQTKFTSRGGQDHRLPYDSNAPLATQVQQSFAKSLEHLGTDKIDSYVLHGPSTRLGLNHEDWEIWREMEALYRQEKVRYLGVSNVNLDQLRALCEEASVKPSFVQNRCFAKMMWDGLSSVKRVKLYGPPPSERRTPTIGFTIDGVTAEQAVRALVEKGLFLSHGDFYALTVIERLGVEALIRAGCACYTSDEEVDRLIEGVREIVR